MRAADLTVVTALGIASKASWGYGPDEMNVFKKELTLAPKDLNELLAAQVAWFGQTIMGYFTIRQHEAGMTELEHFFVAPDQFGKGIGTQLFRQAIETCGRLGVPTLTIIADPNSAGFYEKMGGVKVDEHQSSIPGRTIPIYQVTT